MGKLKTKFVESAIEVQIAVLEEQIKNIKLQRKTLKVRKTLLSARQVELLKLKEDLSVEKDPSVQHVVGIDTASEGRSVTVHFVAKVDRRLAVRIRIEHTPKTFVAYVYDKRFFTVQAMTKQQLLNYLKSPSAPKQHIYLTVNGKLKMHGRMDSLGLYFNTFEYIKTL